MSFVSDFKDATIGVSGYPRLAQSPAGGFGYMALLLAIVLAVSALISTVQVSRSVTAAMTELAGGPDFALRNGTFNFDGPMPHRVDLDNAISLVIDTTGQTTAESLKRVNAGTLTFLVTADKVHQVRSGQVETTELGMMPPITLTKADLVGLMERAPTMVAIAHLFIYIAQLGFKALDAVVLGLVALVYGSVVGRKIPFELGFKLGLYAMTMPILIQWLIPGFTTLNRFGFSVWWAVAATYLILGIRAVHQAEEEPTAL